MLLSQSSPLTTGALNESVIDLDDDSYSWIDLAVRGTGPSNPSDSSLEVCQELSQLPLGNSYMFSVSKNAVSDSKQYVSVSHIQKVNSNSSPNQARSLASADYLEMSLTLEKLTWILCGSANIRAMLLRALHIFLPSHSYVRVNFIFFYILI